MEALIIKVRDKDRVLLGFETPENMTGELVEEAVSQGSHYYLAQESAGDSLRQTPIGSRVEFQYRWRFEKD